MTQDTALGILRENERRKPQNVRNIEIYFNSTKELEPAHRRAVDNFLIGWLSSDVDSAKWEEALKYALACAKDSMKVSR